MNEKLTYNGVVTLIHRLNNQIVSKKYYNNGTSHLFEAYTRALCGQSIQNFIPKRINVVRSDSSSAVIPGVTIPILLSYKDADTDGADYGQPYCRVSINLLSSMFDSSLRNGEQLKVQLISTGGMVLAEVMVDGLAGAINSASAGIQLIMLWDLYVDNETPNSRQGDER